MPGTMLTTEQAEITLGKPYAKDEAFTGIGSMGKGQSNKLLVSQGDLIALRT